MGELVIPEGYKSVLSLHETQQAIKLVKDTFQMQLAKTLNLDRITAPIIVVGESGINDDLNGVERKVQFTMKNVEGTAEVVQSLAKWKRYALYRYGYTEGCGIYTDMNAIRRDDDVDNLHSIFVDQWDWEFVINKEQRTIEFLIETVQKIMDCFTATHEIVKGQFPKLSREFKNEVFFITAQQLEEMYEEGTPYEREVRAAKRHKTVFVMQIGGGLHRGIPHDRRAPDYDDWMLNGDLLVWDDLLECPVELMSMGIRVNAESLLKQLKISGNEDRLKYDYHKKIMEGVLPLTIGGGIGQSRLCMMMLQKAHIGEVQVSVWPGEMVEQCDKNGIMLL